MWSLPVVNSAPLRSPGSRGVCGVSGKYIPGDRGDEGEAPITNIIHSRTRSHMSSAKRRRSRAFLPGWRRLPPLCTLMYACAGGRGRERGREGGGGLERRCAAGRCRRARASIVKFSYKFLLDVNSKSAAGGPNKASRKGSRDETRAADRSKEGVAFETGVYPLTVVFLAPSFSSFLAFISSVSSFS